MYAEAVAEPLSFVVHRPQLPTVGDRSAPDGAAPLPRRVRIFISYRRSDDQHFSGRVYDKLVSRYGHDAVLCDIDSIPAGQLFSDLIEARLRDVDVVVALIGPTWVDRLGTPDDFVRMELLHALGHHHPIIPVLVDDTPLPKREELPESLRPLLGRNTVRVRRDPGFIKT